MDAFYTTANGNKYPLEFYAKRISTKDLTYQPEIIRNLCKTGCSNYGRAGGCPPRSPLLEKIIDFQSECWLIASIFWSKYKPEKVNISNNSAIHWKFQDGILARVLNNIGHDLIDTSGGFFLATGYCMGCPGKKCNFKLGNNHCRNPKKRTYSLEATGINVVETVKKQLGFDMYWYKPGKTDIPYMLKCIAWFPKSDEKANIELIYRRINSQHNLSLN